MSIPRGLVCEELHQVRHDGEPYWLHITITASPVKKASNDPLPSPPFHQISLPPLPLLSER